MFLCGDLDQDRCSRTILHKIKGADESVTRVDSSVPLKYHDVNDLGSLILILIQITPKEHAIRRNHEIPLTLYSLRVPTETQHHDFENI